MDIENATRTRAFIIPLVKYSASPEGDPVKEFLHVLEDSFSHNEVWPQPYDHLYVSHRGGRSVGKAPDADATAVEPEDLELEPVPSNEIMAEDSHEPDQHLDDAGN